MIGVHIPEDMLDREKAKSFGAVAVVSVRDMMVALGASDDDLQEHDERREIIEAEPWRDKTYFEPSQPGSRFGFIRGEIDWTGTKFEKWA